METIVCVPNGTSSTNLWDLSFNWSLEWQMNYTRKCKSVSILYFKYNIYRNTVILKGIDSIFSTDLTH